MDDPRYEPEKVEANRDVGLRITWGDDHVTTYDLVWTRRSCPCAVCADVRGRGEAVWPARGAPVPLDVVSAKLVGAYGISFQWNDGHETGIYSWQSLRDGCPCRECRAKT